MTGRKNTLVPQQIISAGDMSTATVTSSLVPVVGLDNFTLYIVFTGSPVGTFAVQTLADNSSTWVALNLLPAPVAAGSGDTIVIRLRDLPDTTQIRVVYTKTSGTGTLNAWISGKMV